MFRNRVGINIKTIKGIHKLNGQSIVLYILNTSGKCLSDLFAWLGGKTDIIQPTSRVGGVVFKRKIDKLKTIKMFLDLEYYMTPLIKYYNHIPKEQTWTTWIDFQMRMQ